MRATSSPSNLDLNESMKSRFKREHGNLDLNESTKSRFKWEHGNLDLNESMKSRFKWDFDQKIDFWNLDLNETVTPRGTKYEAEVGKNKVFQRQTSIGGSADPRPRVCFDL